MANLPVTLAIRDYDFVAPLAMGDVNAEGIDLTLIRAFDALPRVTRDPAIHGGEASFSRTVQGLASGDRSLVPLPAFVMRAFRHRCFFVRQGSGLTDVTHLAGKRVGTDAWPASGNTWSRSILRGGGVDIWSIRWFVGSVNPGDAPPAPDVLPLGVELAPAGRSLRDMLLAGELDALMCPWPPAGFYEKDSPIVRLYADYRAAERDYYRRTKIYPAHHIVALKRELVDRHPWTVRRIYTAFKEARGRSDDNRWKNPDSSPWLLADLEEQAALMGPGYQPYGFRENRPMVAAFCDEQLAQGLVAKPLDPEAVFADFEKLASR
jgi:4,5-dihydroxyphthalate decarboxylase